MTPETIKQASDLLAEMAKLDEFAKAARGFPDQISFVVRSHAPLPTTIAAVSAFVEPERERLLGQLRALGVTL